MSPRPNPIARILAATLLACILVAAVAAASSGAADGCGFTRVDVGGKGIFPVQIDASDPNNVWAVGSLFDGGHGVPYAMRWDRDRWIDVPVPNPASKTNASLHDVAVAGPDYVWAVGTSKSDTTLVERWDGSSWAVVPSPNLGEENQLTGVTAVATDVAWAVGRRSEHRQARTLVERWDGSAWRIVASRNLGRSSSLRDVDAADGDDVWAVGWWVNARRLARPLVQHWDGSTWRVEQVPGGRGGDRFLTGVSVVGHDVWAVGWTGVPDAYRPLVLHRDASGWAEANLPDVGVVAQLVAVDASRSGVVAVGQASDDRGAFHPLVLRWDGSGWTEAPEDEPGREAFLSGVVSVGEAAFWIAGARSLDAEGLGTYIGRGCDGQRSSG